MAVSSILATLAPRKVAVLLPAVPEVFWPRTPLYESLAEDLRGPRVDLFAVVLPFGIVPESSLLRSPELFSSFYGQNERAALREAVLRMRVWLNEEGPVYQRVILVAWGPAMHAWSRAVVGTKNGVKIQIVTVPRKQGLRSTMIQTRLTNAVQGVLR